MSSRTSILLILLVIFQLLWSRLHIRSFFVYISLVVCKNDGYSWYYTDFIVVEISYKSWTSHSLLLKHVLLPYWNNVADGILCNLNFESVVIYMPKLPLLSLVQCSVIFLSWAVWAVCRQYKRILVLSYSAVQFIPREMCCFCQMVKIQYFIVQCCRSSWT
jgi:hypothetical protein